MEYIGRDLVDDGAFERIDETLRDPKRLGFFRHDGITTIVWDNGCYYEINRWNGIKWEYANMDMLSYDELRMYEALVKQLHDRITNTANIDGDGI